MKLRDLGGSLVGGVVIYVVMAACSVMFGVGLIKKMAKVEV